MSRMRMLRAAVLRLRGFFGRDRLDRELTAELETMRIPLPRGRALADDDLRTSARAAIPVIVNETLARRYLESGAIGAELVLERNTESGRAERRLRVVGVARDVKTRSLADEDGPVVYLPSAGTSMVVRFAAPAAAALIGLQPVVADRLLGAVVTVTSMADRVAAAAMPARVGTLLLSALAGLGLLIALLFLVLAAEFIVYGARAGARAVVRDRWPFLVVWLVGGVVLYFRLVATSVEISGHMTWLPVLTTQSWLLGFPAWFTALGAVSTVAALGLKLAVFRGPSGLPGILLGLTLALVLTLLARSRS